MMTIEMEKALNDLMKVLNFHNMDILVLRDETIRIELKDSGEFVNSGEEANVP